MGFCSTFLYSGLYLFPLLTCLLNLIVDGTGICGLWRFLLYFNSKLCTLFRSNLQRCASQWSRLAGKRIQWQTSLQPGDVLLPLRRRLLRVRSLRWRHTQEHTNRRRHARAASLRQKGRISWKISNGLICFAARMLDWRLPRRTVHVIAHKTSPCQHNITHGFCTAAQGLPNAVN